MWQAFRILIAAGFTVAAATAAGTLLLRRSARKLYRTEEILLAFVLGSGCLSLAVFLLASCKLARSGVFIGCGAVLIGICYWDGRGRAPGGRLPDYPHFWKLLFLAAFALFSILYFLHALAPECSPEGSAENLPLVAHWARDHGFTNHLDIRAPQGVNMLFLFAFTMGKHSAAALVHFAFLLTLPLLMLSYSRRMGFPRAGVLGAIFTFASPIVGVDGSSAAHEVALATIAFALFYLFQIWDSKHRARATVTALCAMVMMALWFTRGVPHQSYDSIRHLAEIPLQTAILGGPLGGLTGPLFLLAPVALIALRQRAGRQLLLAAAVFGSTYPLDIATRFLIPALPFVSLAMGLALADARILGPLLAFAHLFLSYPKVVSAYCDPNAWRVETVQLRVALRRRPEESYLTSRLPDYGITRALDQLVAKNGKVFTQRPIPSAYTSREVLVAHRDTRNLELLEILRTPLVPAKWPVRHQCFQFPAQRLRAVRVLQTGTGRGEWVIHELRLFLQSRELPRAPEWRLSATPNPWNIQLAFDNSPVTCWRSGGDLRPDMRVEVDLGGPAELDAVLIETCPEQGPVQLRLQGHRETGAWMDLAATAEISEVVRPAGLRRFAAREFKARGVDYILTADSDFQAADFREKPALWGIREITRSGDLRLYRVW